MRLAALLLARHQLVEVEAVAAPAQAGGQGVLDLARLREPVAPLAHAVAFVGKAHELDRPAQLAQLGDHVVGVLAQHAHVVAAMDHQQRRGDAVDLRDGRVGEHLRALVGLVHVAVEQREVVAVAPERRPVLDHARPVGHAHHVDAAAVVVRLLDQLRQHRIAAEARAQHRHALRVGHALVDGPLHGLGDVALHAVVGLAGAGHHEGAAVAGRAAVVHVEHRVAAVGQHLRAVVAGRAPAVAHPRAAVDVDHQRRRALHPARAHEVAVHRQPVRRLEGEGLHGREDVVGRRARRAQALHLLRAAVPQQLDVLVLGHGADHHALAVFGHAPRAGDDGFFGEPSALARLFTASDTSFCSAGSR
jgi:hypothetical protein